jgi:hypothetical protein
MSSGEKQLIVNALERALSSDVMRLQSFSAAQTNEFLRGLFDTGQGTDDLDAGALVQPNSIAGTPSAGEIITGFLLAPTAGGTSCSVGVVAGAPNVLFILDPDTSPNPDDSQYKFINDPGTSSLSLTPNSSGSTRIDVLECARVQPDTIIETDNRDIYNTVTGTFGAATVNKVSIAQLQYRIRQGTPASGYPAAVQGWLPLYVLSVPTGTTTWDTVCIWDVRPLVNDRQFGVSPLTQSFNSLGRCIFSESPQAGGEQSDITVTGLVEATLAGRRVGGQLRRGSPGTDSASLAIGPTTQDNVAASTAFVTGGWVYLYLACPFGLPRWARFTDGPSGRVPRSPRGMPIVSTVAPVVNGTPVSAIPLPPSTGLGGTVSTAICVAAWRAAGSTDYFNMMSDGKSQIMASGGYANVASSAGVTGCAWNLVPGVDFPPNAKRIYASTAVEFAGGGTITNPDNTLAVMFNDGYTAWFSVFDSARPSNASTLKVSMSGWLPLPPSYPGPTGVSPVMVQLQSATTGVSSVPIADLLVTGWEF